MLVRIDLPAAPPRLHTLCQGCGELVPTARIREHLAEHSRGTRPLLPAAEAYERGLQALRRTKGGP
jgi:hypothetical protein